MYDLFSRIKLPDQAAKLLGLRLAQMALTQQPQVFGYKVWCNKKLQISMKTAGSR